MQLLYGDLHRRGLFASLEPNGASFRFDGDAEEMEDGLREKVVAAEMVRRTFTNCCNIMTRHNFVDAWGRWKADEVE